MDFDRRIRRVVAAHFDPRWGSPYWLDRARSLSFDPIQDVNTVKDLRLFGPMDLSLLAREPVERFIPRKFHDRLDRFVTAETGGTTGPPKRTAYTEEEFTAAFVTPFLESATLMRFPRDVHWLYVGPSGPHIIGKAARACAIAMGSIDPFMVDFDPRWARKLPVDSLARTRYVRHVTEQALAILHTQEIGVLFSTPPILATLGTELEQSLRENVQGIHLGGMPAAEEFWSELQGAWYPNAYVMGGYGNSLFGMCPQLQKAPYHPSEYFVHGDRLILEVESFEGDTRGPIKFHRLDESSFLPNCIERDDGEVVELPSEFSGREFQPTGIRDPRPPKSQQEMVQSGLY